MNITTPEDLTMIDQNDPPAATLWRVALCAFTYYPDKAEQEPGYSIDNDVAWCTAPLKRLPSAELVELRGMVRNLIADQAADRRDFIDRLAELPRE